MYNPGKKISDTAKKVGGAVKKAFDDTSDFVSNAATKTGLGQYKPGAINASAYTDDSDLQGRRKDMTAMRDVAGSRQATQVTAAQLGAAAQAKASQLDPTKQAQFRDSQLNLARQLEEQAAGRGPSLAATQLNEAKNQQIQTAMALAASQRGLTAGQGLRSIADQTANAGQFAASESAKLRIAEQLAARDQLAGVQTAGRGADIDMATQNAGLAQQAALANQAATNQFAMQNAANTQQVNLANQNAALTQTGLNDQFQTGLNNNISALAAKGFDAQMALEALKVQQQQIEAGAFKDKQERTGNFLGKLGEGAASAVKMFAK